VPGVDVHERERELRRPERLLGEAQDDDRVLAAGEQQARPLTLGCDLAQDVDGLVLERLKMGSTIGRNPWMLSPVRYLGQASRRDGLLRGPAAEDRGQGAPRRLDGRAIEGWEGVGAGGGAAAALGPRHRRGAVGTLRWQTAAACFMLGGRCGPRCS